MKKNATERKKGILMLFTVAIFALFFILPADKVSAETTILTTDNMTDSFAYKTDSSTKTATLTNYYGDYTDISIPNTMKVGITTYTITKIGDGCFSGEYSYNKYTYDKCRALTNVVLPSGITEIGEGAFKGCTNLQKVDLSKCNAITKIGDYCFSNCSKLLSAITIPNATYIGKHAFYNCSSIEVFEINSNGINQYDGFNLPFDNCNSVKRLTIYGTGSAGGYFSPSDTSDLLRDMNNLETVTIKEGITSIPAYMFLGKRNLKTVTLPSSLRTIDKGAFQGTGVDDNVYLDKVSSIGDYAFSNCPNLQHISLKQSIELGEGVFSDSGLISAEIGDTDLIPMKCFDNCTSLETLRLPSNLTTIYSYAFSGTSIKSFTIPANVEHIGTNTFNGCEALEKVNIACKATTIPDYCFKGCTSLSEVTLGENVSYIDIEAFYNCNSLSRIELPSAVSKINARCFESCTNLQEVILDSESVQFVYDCFKDIGYKSTITVRTEEIKNKLDTATYITKARTSVVFKPLDNTSPTIVSITYPTNYITIDDAPCCVTVEATDDISTKLTYTYKAGYGKTPYTTEENQYNVYENCTLYVTVTDEAGNEAKDEVVISCFDTLPPKIETDAERKKYPNYTTDKDTIGIQITDDRKSFSMDYSKFNLGKMHPDGGYALDFAKNKESYKIKTDVNELDWIKKESYSFVQEVTENGFYYIYARDIANNLSCEEVEINCIDKWKPIITLVKKQKNENDTYLLKFRIEEDYTKEVASGIDGFGFSWYIIDSKGGDLVELQDTDGHTYYEVEIIAKDITDNPWLSARDMAGNLAYCYFTMNEEEGVYEAYNPIKKFLYENADKTTQYPDYTKGKVRVTFETDTGTNPNTKETISLAENPFCTSYPAYEEGKKADESFSGKEMDEILYGENGTYPLYVKASTGYVYKYMISINNIDKNAPNMEAVFDGKNINFTVTDDKSGLGEFRIVKDSLTTIEQYHYNGEKEATRSVGLTEDGTYLLHAEDRLGNVREVEVSTEGKIKENQLNKNDEKEKETFVVSFLSYNGAIVKSMLVDKNKDAVPPDRQYMIREGYTFLGWDSPYAGITKDTVINAVWVRNDCKAKVTVEFLSEQGAVIKSETVAVGESASPPSDDAMKLDGYVFVGWDKPYSNVKEDISIAPVYEKETEEDRYVVCFLDNTGAIISSQAIKKGESAVPPSKEEMKREGYVFLGWDSPYTDIQKSRTVHGLYWDEANDALVNGMTKQNVSYTVNFTGEEDAVLSSQRVAKGKDAVPPAKEQMAVNGKVFLGWDSPYTNIQNNATIRAVYKDADEKKETYNVTFFCEDYIVSSQNVKRGENAVPPTTEQMAREGYDFIGFDAPYNQICKDVIIHGVYRKKENTESHIVNFYSYRDAIVNSQYVEDGENATPPSPKEMKRDGYVFAGWDTSYTKITKDTDVFAIWQEDAMLNEVYYRVDFYGDNDAILSSQSVKRGKDATPPTKITAPENKQFVGWSSSYANINDDTKIYALWKDSSSKSDTGNTKNNTSDNKDNVKEYLVSFVDDEGNVLSSQMVKEGEDATPPAKTEKNGYTFVGYNKPYVNIKRDTVVTAKYVSNSKNKTEAKSYLVVFKMENGAVIDAQTVEEGKSAIAPSVPQKKGYSFAGWSVPFGKITSDVETVAIYEKNEELQPVTVTATNKDSYQTRDAKEDNSNKSSKAESKVQLQTKGIRPLSDYTKEAMLLPKYVARLKMADEFANTKEYDNFLARSVGALTNEKQEDSPNNTADSTNENERKGVLFAQDVYEDGTQMSFDDERFLQEDTISNDKTMDGEVTMEQKSQNSNNIIVVIVLFLGISGVLFYFLNKKYYWIDLPF